MIIVDREGNYKRKSRRDCLSWGIGREGVYIRKGGGETKEQKSSKERLYSKEIFQWTYPPYRPTLATSSRPSTVSPVPQSLYAISGPATRMIRYGRPSSSFCFYLRSAICWRRNIRSGKELVVGGDGEVLEGMAVVG